MGLSVPLGLVLLIAHGRYGILPRSYHYYFLRVCDCPLISDAILKHRVIRTMGLFVFNERVRLEYDVHMCTLMHISEHRCAFYFR